MNYQPLLKIYFDQEIRSFLLHHAIKNDQGRILLSKIKVFSALKKVKDFEYTCPCPWCQAETGFIFNKKSGDCSCSSCSKSGDLIDLILETTNTALDSVMIHISIILKMWGMP